jgi:hypothetical protein
VHKTDEAARTIAALLDLAAIGIENSIAKVDFRTTGFFNQKDLIATDTEVPVSEIAKLCGA